MGDSSLAAVEATVAIPKWRSFLLEIDEVDFLTAVHDPGTLRLLQTMDAIPSSIDENLLLLPSGAFLDGELQAYYVGNAVSPSAATLTGDNERETNMSNDSWMSYCFAFASHGELVKRASGLIPTHSDNSHLSEVWESVKTHYDNYVNEHVRLEDEAGADWMLQQINSATCPYFAADNDTKGDEDRKVYILLCTLGWVVDMLFYKGDLQICIDETMKDVKHYEIPLKKGQSQHRLKVTKIIPMFDQRVVEKYSKKNQKVSLIKSPVFECEPSVLPVPRKTLEAFTTALQTELHYSLRLDCGMIIPTDPELCFSDKNTISLKKVDSADDEDDEGDPTVFPVWGSLGPLTAIKAGQDLLRIPSDTACKSKALSLLNEDADWFVPNIMLGSQLAVGHKNKTSMFRDSVKPVVCRSINLNQFMEESHREKIMQMKRSMLTSHISALLVSPNSYTCTTNTVGKGASKKTKIHSGFSPYKEELETLIGRFVRLASGSLTRVWGMLLTFSLPASIKRNQEQKLKDWMTQSSVCETCHKKECFESIVADSPKTIASLNRSQSLKKRPNPLLCFMNNRSLYSGNNLVGPLGNLEDQKTSFNSKKKRMESSTSQQQMQQQAKKPVESYEAANFIFARKLRDSLYFLIKNAKSTIAMDLLKVHEDSTFPPYQKTYKMTTMLVEFMGTFVPALTASIKNQCREVDVWMKDHEYGPNSVNFESNPVKGLLEGSLGLTDKLLEGPMFQMMAMVSNLMLVRLSKLQASQGKLQLSSTAVDTLRGFQEIMEKSTHYSFSANWGNSITSKVNVRIMDGCSARSFRRTRPLGGIDDDDEESATTVQKLSLNLGKWLSVSHVRVKPTIYCLRNPEEDDTEEQDSRRGDSSNFYLQLVIKIMKLCLIPNNSYSNTFSQAVNQLLQMIVLKKELKNTIDRTIGRNIPDSLTLDMFHDNDSYLPSFCSMVVANYILDRLAIKPAPPLFASDQKRLISQIGGYSGQKLMKRKSKRETSYCDSVNALRKCGLDSMMNPQELRYNDDLSFLGRFPSNILAPMCVNSFSAKGSVYHKLDIAPIYNLTGDAHLFGSEKIDVGQYNNDFKPNRRVLAVPSFVTDIHSLNYEGCFGSREAFQAEYGWTDTNNIHLHQSIAFGEDFCKQKDYLDSPTLLAELMSDCYFATACSMTGSPIYKEQLFAQRRAMHQYIAMLHEQPKPGEDQEEFRMKLKEWVVSMRHDDSLQLMHWDEAHVADLVKEEALKVVGEDDPMFVAVLELTKGILTGREAYKEAKNKVQCGEWYSYLSNILQPELMNAAMDALNKLSDNNTQQLVEPKKIEEVDLERFFDSTNKSLSNPAKTVDNFVEPEEEPKISKSKKRKSRDEKLGHKPVKKRARVAESSEED